MACGLVAMLATPRPALAYCENPFVAMAVGGVTIASNKLLLQTLESMVKAGWTAIFTMMNYQMGEILLTDSDSLEKTVIGTGGVFPTLWKNWDEAMEGMTAEMSASISDQTLKIAAASDAHQMNRTAARLQKNELKTKIEIQPNDESCRFDTAAIAQRQATPLVRGMIEAIGMDFNKIANSRVGSAAAQGAEKFLNERFKKYATNFCDPSGNAGHAGCTPSAARLTAQSLPPTSYYDAHVTPSRTLFRNYTIDMEDEKIRDATNELIYNITGYKVPDIMPPDVIKKLSGKEQRLKDREYMTQMDAVVALPGMIVAERTPGAFAPEIKAMRDKVAGAPVGSSRPSEREIRQAKIEELWTPNYYVRLGSNATEVTRKELYLQALNVAQLYKLIEKTEKISTIYAMETGNLVDKTDNSRGDAANLLDVKN